MNKDNESMTTKPALLTHLFIQYDTVQGSKPRVVDISVIQLFQPSLTYTCTHKHTYSISSNKCPGTYFLQGFQDQALKQDQALNQNPAVISYRLFRRYGGPMTFISCGTPTCYLSSSSSGPLPMAGMAFIWAPRKGLCFSIWCSKSQSFNEHQRAFIWQIDHSTNGRSLEANFAVELHVHTVYEAHPLRTPAFIWTTALISYRAVKHLGFKLDQAFIQIRHLFEEIRHIPSPQYNYVRIVYIMYVYMHMYITLNLNLKKTNIKQVHKYSRHLISTCIKAPWGSVESARLLAITHKCMWLVITAVLQYISAITQTITLISRWIVTLYIVHILYVTMAYHKCIYNYLLKKWLQFYRSI